MSLEFLRVLLRLGVFARNKFISRKAANKARSLYLEPPFLTNASHG
jgi:hypothetical protein